MWPGRVRFAYLVTCLAITPSFMLCAFNSNAQEGPTVVAEAPPLLWPAWLVHLDGSQLKIQQGVDQSKKDYLRAAFYTHAPMTQIQTFYGDLLKTKDYRIVTAGLETGHTIAGTSQNAWGHVEADNYPNGQPGPYTNIRVDYGRSVLNGPIRVSIKLTAHPYVRYGPEISHRHKLPPLPGVSSSSQAREKADEWERKSTGRMEKYDKPVAPRRGPPVPGLAWPAWLVHIEGQQLQVRQTLNNSSMMAFSSTYTTNTDSESIRAFYADLLTYNGYSVDPIYTNNFPRLRGSSGGHMGSVKGVAYPNGSPGPRVEILVQYRPVDMRGSDLPMKVDLRVSGFPADEQ